MARGRTIVLKWVLPLFVALMLAVFGVVLLGMGYYELHVLIDGVPIENLSPEQVTAAVMKGGKMEQYSLVFGIKLPGSLWAFAFPSVPFVVGFVVCRMALSRLATKRV
ncbi:MAG: hypothetical protein QF893_00315 [Alphaproteobacteria bacterium]|jgi:hypothetical protein|nr:hypothetical protein [Alphaproteobacteria bacterium]